MDSSAIDATISAFGDEIHPDFDTQIEVLTDLGIDQIDLRGVDGTSVLDLSDEKLEATKATLDDRGIDVSAIGSPIGKVDVTGGRAESPVRSSVGSEVPDFESHLDDLERVFEIAGIVDADYVRVFSYYVPEGDDPAEYSDEVIRRMRRKTELAEEHDVPLLHENLLDEYGEAPDRCREILTAVDSPHLRAIFDPVNFVLAGAEPYPDALLQLVEFVDVVHVKDARPRPDGHVEFTTVGEGDVDVKSIVKALDARGFDGVYSFEPHLSFHDDTSEGISGVEEFRSAVRAFERTLADLD